MKYSLTLLLLGLLLPLSVAAQVYQRLELPNRELLSSEKVLYVMQDREGFLWYGTDGGGVCRDDGRQVDVFRSDAEHPDLLGSNTVICLAEAGMRIIIGTTHGANVLDKRDYSIHRLTAVDDKRVDDIVVAKNGHWWLTSNKKVYEYSADGALLHTYHAADKYIFRLHEDRQGRIWCKEWEGGTLLLDRGRFVRTMTEWPDSMGFTRVTQDSQGRLLASLSRVTTDNQGRLLVSDSFGDCFAVSEEKQKQWFQGTIFTREAAAALREARHLTALPTAIATGKKGELWFSTGRDIRCLRHGKEEIILRDMKDVSAMAFTPDGTLWLATIYGQLHRYRNGKVEADEYCTNEYGDGIIAMSADTAGRLIMVSDRYTRLYDVRRHTLRQQSRESSGTYCIELQETKPGERWSQPGREKVVEKLPRWMTSWWMYCVYGLTAAGMCLLAAYILTLRRQRKKFMEQMRTLASPGGEAVSHPTSPQPSPTQSTSPEDEWLRKAISLVEANLSDDAYTVEQMSSDMCMSRMTFYRKIQSLTGQKPTEFMRTIRLRHAAEMIREGGHTITEVSYATGFSSVSYFSRCFRAMFGVPPTRFGET